jgi:hypothetical protein
MLLRVATLNLLSDLTHWKERSPILVSGLAALGADLLALQEVNLEINTATWLAEKLAYPYLHLTPKTGGEGKNEGSRSSADPSRTRQTSTWDHRTGPSS